MPTYVPYYQNDIFVSYAIVDNEPLAGAHQGWVTTLVNGLKTLLKQKLGRPDAYQLWMDERGHEAQMTEVQAQLQSSALLVLILSPAYLVSKQQELELFLAQASQDSGRIFVVERDYVEQRPKALQDLLGYKFWFTDERSGQPRILAVPQPKPEEIEYYQKLDDLARQMTSQLKSLKAEIEAVTLTRARQTQYTLPIFLAEVTDDLEEHYQELQRYFDQLNIPFLPKKTHFFNQNIQAALDRELAQCQAFIQLLSDKAGKGYPQLQYERAKLSGLPIYQWRDRKLDYENVQDKVHLNLLMGDRVIASTLVEFQTYVLEQLSQPQPELTAAITEDNLVFINATPEDRPLAEDIVSWLGQYDTIGYSLPLDITVTTQPEEIRANLEHNLLSCDAIIVVYAQASVVWVTEQLLYCRRLQGRREQPLKVIVVYDKPTVTQTPLTLKLPHMHILTCPEPQSCLPQFIQLLNS